MDELYFKNGQLTPEKEWVKEISKLKTKVFLKDKKQAKKNITERIVCAIEKRIPEKKFGILFSGGVDSSLIARICQNLKKDFVCYTVGFQDNKTQMPPDVAEARKVAKKFGLRAKSHIYNLKEAEKIIEKTRKILSHENKVDVVNIGVGAVVLSAIEIGKKEGIECFFSGLGSEEIFAGYERHQKAEDVNKESWKGLKKMWDRDLVRDCALAQSLKVKIMTPFLDPDLIQYAMKIPGAWKISQEEKKIILREVAEMFLGKFAWRKKKAAQYGSCFDKALKKLAKKSGFKKKGEYLNSRI